MILLTVLPTIQIIMYTWKQKTLGKGCGLWEDGGSFILYENCWAYAYMKWNMYICDLTMICDLTVKLVDWYKKTSKSLWMEMTTQRSISWVTRPRKISLADQGEECAQNDIYYSPRSCETG